MIAPGSGLHGRFSYHCATDVWWWSDDIYRIHGFEPGDVVPSTELIMAHKHPDDVAPHQAFVAHVLGHGGSFAHWHRLLDAQRGLRHVVAVAEGVRPGAGPVTELRGFVVDVSAASRGLTAIEIDEAVRRSAESRAAIEQAKGVLMAALALNEDAAFEHLRHYSQHANVKVRDLAQELLDCLAADPQNATGVAQALFGDVATEPTG